MSPRRLAAALLLLPLVACGHGGPPGGRGPGGPSPMLREAKAAVDCRLKPYAGADGALTREALDKGLRTQFAAADLNGDGVLDKAEVAALNAARAGTCDPEPVIDWNGDGRMSYATYAARTYTLFDRADDDRDGIVSQQELNFAVPPSREPRMPDPDGNRGAP